MGLNAGLYIIPAKKFATAQAKGTWGRHAWHNCEPWFDLDKAWFEINDILEKCGPPLAYAITGDLRPNPEELDFAFVSPDVVAGIAQALERIATEEIVDKIERRHGKSWEDRDWQREYYASYFEELRTAYQTAAKRGAAVGILVC
jgi:hypothetical protein